MAQRWCSVRYNPASEPRWTVESTPRSPPAADPAGELVRRAKLLRPWLPADVLSRPRLLRRLNDALDRPLTLVVAPAGYGKSTALAQWTSGLRLPVAWLTLDADDNHLPRFLAHLIAALQSVVPAAGRLTGSMVRLPRLPEAAQIGAQLADDLVDLSAPLVLVLDDYQVITGADVHDIVRALVAYPPPCLRLVISSRSPPPLDVARLRARGQVFEVRAADLSFDKDETRRLFAMSSVRPVARPVVTQVHDRTEGWIAALHLTLQALRDHGDPAALLDDVTSAPRRPLVEHLVEEMLAGRSRDEYDFLLKTSVTEMVSAPLAAALLADTTDAGSRALFDALAGAEFFLAPHRSDGGLCRYHPLVRQVLRLRLQQERGDEQVAQLHLRASAWFAGEGMIEEAVHHALAGGDVDGAARIIERAVQPALAAEAWLTVEHWLRLLPDDLVRTRPQLLLARGWCAQVRGSVLTVESCLHDLRRWLDNEAGDGDHDALARVRAEFEALSLVPLPIPLHARSLAETARGVLERLPPDRRFARGNTLYVRAQALQALGRMAEAIAEIEATQASAPDGGVVSLRALLSLISVHLTDADFVEVVALARRTLVTATSAGMTLSAAWARHCLGIACYECDDLAGAAEYLTQVLAQPDQAHMWALHDSALCMALVHQACGRPHEARMVLAQLIALLEESGNQEWLDQAYAFRARLALLQGDLPFASRWLATSGARALQNRTYRVETPPLTRLRVLIAQGTPASLAEAVASAERLRQDPETRHHRRLTITALVLQAVAHDGLGQRRAALAMLHEAVVQAASRGLVRTFVDAGPRVAGLLRELASTDVDAAYVAGVLAAFEHTGAGESRTSEANGATLPAPLPAPVHTAVDAVLLDRVTPREVQVLERLQRRLSNKEISAELAISSVTVKRHTINLYSKLGVQSRSQAVRAAVALGLLPAPPPAA
jgi:LuxR family transcriptional regulator, maltose regulon positive regulatory protein